jgi:hypothetical protein
MRLLSVILCSLTFLFSCSNDEKNSENASKNTTAEKSLSTKIAKDTITEDKKELEIIDETNYDFYSKKFILSSKNNSGIENWLKGIVANDGKGRIFDGDLSYMTKDCFGFIKDVIDSHLGYPGSIEFSTLRRKWSGRFDMKYTQYAHLFETGNGGWGTKQLTNVKYLGSLNNGDWFQLTIKGGGGENDFSETLIRVVKVIQENQRYYISNFIGISEN